MFLRLSPIISKRTKAFQLQGKSDLPFTDISPSYEQYKNIEVLYHHEITTGTTPTTYNPYAPVTRQQFATFIMRSLNASSK
ncbi:MULTISPECIES: S-layer homology domain-containing protein [Ureibacillus]|uniref:S-layer homology domain-containing protein n=1 Tax=Ureibacillus TaxID=160795 RepID=UPI000A0410CC